MLSSPAFRTVQFEACERCSLCLGFFSVVFGFAIIASHRIASHLLMMHSQCVFFCAVTIMGDIRFYVWPEGVLIECAAAARDR